MTSNSGNVREPDQKSLELPEAKNSDRISPEDEVPSALWSPAQREATASYYYLAGEYAMLAGETDRAANFLDTAYNLDPDPFLGGKVLGVKAETSQGPAVLSDARKLVLLYPKSARLHRYYGILLSRDGDHNKAIVELERSIELDSRDETSYLLLIELYLTTKQPDKALAVAKEFSVVAPESVASWLELAKLYLSRDQRKQALGAAETAFELDGRSPEVTLIYAICLDFNGKSSEALRYYERLYRDNSTSDQLIGRMVSIYNEIGGLEKALEFLDDALRAQEASNAKTSLHIQRAIILWELERFEESAAALENLTISNPDSDMIWYMAGLAQEKLKNTEKAGEFYEKISKNSPLQAQALFRRANILRQEKNGSWRSR